MLTGFASWQSGISLKPLIYDNMQKPKYVLDGRNVQDIAKLREIGFIVYSLDYARTRLANNAEVAKMEERGNSMALLTPIERS